MMPISSSIFLFTGISLHDLEFKKIFYYFSYTGPLRSSSVQPLSETGRFRSCLFNMNICTKFNGNQYNS